MVSIQAVGIIMVVAMLVTPAATGQLLVDKFWDLVRIAIAVAVVAAVSGLYLSFYLNVASGASIVLVETLFFALALLFSPKSGWISKRRKRPGARIGVGPAGLQPPAAASSEIVRIRGNGDRTRNRIEAAIPAQPRAIPPRTPIWSATTAAESAPIG